MPGNYNTNHNPIPSALPDLWGSSLTQGIRIGPSSISEGVSLPELDEGQRYSGAQLQAAEDRMMGLDQWGPGVYTGGIFTYRILPTPVEENSVQYTYTPNVVKQDNVVNQFIPTTTTSQLLPLGSRSGTPRPTYLYTDGVKNYLQLDFPRTIIVYQATGQTMVYNIHVFGWDLYGQRMMEKIEIASGYESVTGKKAFWRISDVYFEYVSGSLVAGKYIAIGVSNTFGLPYTLSQACHMLAYSQADTFLNGSQAPGYLEGAPNWPVSTANWPQATYPGSPPYTPNGGNYGAYQPVTDTTANTATPDLVNLPWQISVPSYVIGADINTPTSTTFDVRGVFKPKSTGHWLDVQFGALTYEFTFSELVDGLGTSTVPPEKHWIDAQYPYITFTYYIAGADMYQNQILAQQQFCNQSFGVPMSMWQTVSPNRDQVGIKGLPQYWTEPPTS